MMAVRSAPDPAKITELKRRLAKEPASRSFLELAREYHEAGQLEEAAVVCAQGLKYHPSYLSAQVLLGRIYFDMGKAEESRSQMESVLSQAPDNLVARRVLAWICLDQGDAEGALDRYRALLAFNPADSEARDKIAEIEAQLHPTQSAPEVAPAAAPVEELAPAATTETEGIPIPGALEISASELSMPQEPGPAAPVTEAIAPEPGILATPTLAEIYVQQGLPDKAAQVYREVLTGDPDNAEAQRRLEQLEHAAPQAPDPGALARRRKIEALATWLDGIRRASRTHRDAGTRRN
jgi:tetratricopeptide (TPR) repeat protein